MRKFTDNKLLLATHNKDKIKEIEMLLKDYVINLVSASDLNLAEPLETGKTFAENALLKAKYAAFESGLISLADDSGLSVDALNGDPGVYSARWGGLNKNFQVAMERVHKELGSNSNRKASFICALALAWPDGHAEILEGKVEGEICWPPRGDKGFGYDPIFVPIGHKNTFAEMGLYEKKKYSHRAIAFKSLIEGCF